MNSRNHSSNVITYNFCSPMPELIVQPKLSLQKMKMIQIKDLMLNQIMKNSYLCVKICLPISTNPALSIVIEDQNKDLIEATVCNLPDSILFSGGQQSQYLTQNQWLAIKNPFQINSKTGVKGLRIEDSQDIVLLSNHSVSLLLKTKPEDCSPLQFKEIGNNYFKAQQYSLAYESYTLALKTDDPSLREICLNNRSLCLIHLGWYEEAISDLKEVLTINPQNEKANMRMGNALMELQQPITAMEYFKKIENWKLNHELIQKVVNCEMMKKYQNGDFNLYKLFKEYVLNGKVINVFPYTGPIQRKKSKLGGLGLFATREIKRGEVLIIEFPLMTVTAEESNQDDEEDPKQIKFVNGMRWKAITNKYIAQRLFSLTDGSKDYNTEIIEKDFDYQLNQICCDRIRIDRIFTLNGHAFNVDMTQRSDEGIWQLLAQINHRSFPNCYYYYLGEILILVSAKDIHIDEELLVQYKPTMDFEAYKKIMQEHEIPLEEEIMFEQKNWKKSTDKFKLFHQIESNPTQFNLIQQIDKQLEDQFRQEYPFRYIKVYSEISMSFFRKFDFQNFMKYKIKLLEFELNVLPQCEIIYDLISLIAVAGRFNLLNAQTKQLFKEIGSIMFGAEFKQDNQSLDLLIKYADKETGLQKQI